MKRTRFTEQQIAFALRQVEGGGTPRKIDQALSRLSTQRGKKKILRVPQQDMSLAVERARSKKTKVTVTNLSKTKRKNA